MRPTIGPQGTREAAAEGSGSRALAVGSLQGRRHCTVLGMADVACGVGEGRGLGRGQGIAAPVIPAPHRGSAHLGTDKAFPGVDFWSPAPARAGGWGRVLIRQAEPARSRRRRSGRPARPAHTRACDRALPNGRFLGGGRDEEVRLWRRGA